MCKECEVKQYVSFDELPQELKDMCDNEGRKCSVTKRENNFVRFINLVHENGDELISGLYVKNTSKFKIRWRKCGHTSEINYADYKQGNGCGVCHGLQVQKDVNDIATTEPHLVKYFVNVEDAYTHTRKSAKKVEMKCPQCGHEKMTKICDLTSQGFGCPICGDGVSYPEKVVMNVLSILGLEYKAQLKFDGYKYKYDFLVTNKNSIIEVHGQQHYRDGYGYMKTYEEEHENDLIKYDLAVLHGYEYNKNYFIIDARKSNIDWLKNSIEQCEFFKQFDLSSIDWQEIDIKSQKSLKIEVCKYWQEKHESGENYGGRSLALIFHMDRTTIVDYLKWGAEQGICEYDAKKMQQRSGLRSSHNCRQVICLETKQVFKSTKEASTWAGVVKGVSYCCSGKIKTAGAYHWMYYDEYLKLNENSNPTNNKIA